MRKVLILAVKVYRVALSPILGRCCRFHPSCSSYAIEALERYGSVKGTWLAAARLAKCHPFHPGGVDPVPEPSHLAPERRQTV